MLLPPTTSYSLPSPRLLTLTPNPDANPDLRPTWSRQAGAPLVVVTLGSDGDIAATLTLTLTLALTLTLTLALALTLTRRHRGQRGSHVVPAYLPRR